MASMAANFRSKCGSLRGAPECNSQPSPAAAPHVGQGTEDTCSGVSSLFFMLRECNYTRSRIYTILDTAWPSSKRDYRTNQELGASGFDDSMLHVLIARPSVFPTLGNLSPRWGWSGMFNCRVFRCRGAYPHRTHAAVLNCTVSAQ